MNTLTAGRGTATLCIVGGTRAGRKRPARWFFRLLPAAVLFLILNQAPGLAQQAEPDFLEGEISELVWLNFSGRATESYERVGALLAQDPTDYRAYFIRAMCYAWFSAVKTDNRRYDNQFIESIEACIKNAEAVKRSREDYGHALFFSALALVTEARFKAYRGYKFSSRWSTRSVTNAAEELESFYPRNLDARFPRAVFNYYWGGSSMAGRMAQFALLLPRGSREDGLKVLKECAVRGKSTKLWAELILLDIYTDESKTAEDALRTAAHLHEVFPDNAFFQLSLADCYRERRQWAPAEWVYGSIQEKVMKRTPGYDEVVFEVSRLRTVECQVRLGKMEEAFNTVREILVTNPINPEWVVPWAHYYAARIYRQRGQFLRAERACEYAMNGTDYEDLHKISEEELETIRRLARNQP